MRTLNKLTVQEWAVRENAVNVKKHWVRLTRACNNRCLFCHDKEAQNGTNIPFQQIHKELIEGKKQNATRAVLSGGDPTLHPKLMEIIAFAKKTRYSHIQLITNGRMFAYNNFLDKAISEGLDEITFSVHGHTEKLHDRLTGIPGSFNQTLNGLKNALAKNKLIVSVDIVVNKLNVKFLEQTLHHFIGLGVREFDLLQVMPFGRAWDNRGDMLFNPARYSAHLKKAFDLSLTPGLYIWTNRFRPEYLGGFRHLIQPSLKMLDEIKGREAIFNAFLRKGQKISCFGKKCRFCFLKSFCSDLHNYKQRGRLKSKKLPVCLGHRKENKIEYLVKDRDPNLYRFFDFFRQNRYFTKIHTCASCGSRNGCEGMPVDNARAI